MIATEYWEGKKKYRYGLEMDIKEKTLLSRLGYNIDER